MLYVLCYMFYATYFIVFTETKEIKTKSEVAIPLSPPFPLPLLLGRKCFVSDKNNENGFKNTL